VGRADLSTNTSPHRFRGSHATSSIDASCIGTNLGPLMIQAQSLSGKLSKLRLLVGRRVEVDMGWRWERTWDGISYCLAVAVTKMYLIFQNTKKFKKNMLWYILRQRSEDEK